jgi:hypothetical protein
MTSYYLTSVALGIVLALGILWLVRRDRLHGSYALWWLLLAVGALAVGFYPSMVDWIGARLGVAYPPMLLAMVAIVAILLKLLGIDVDVTRRELRLRRLLQKVAILEAELRELRAATDAAPRPETSPPPSSTTDLGSGDGEESTSAQPIVRDRRAS